MKHILWMDQNVYWNRSVEKLNLLHPNVNNFFHWKATMKFWHENIYLATLLVKLITSYPINLAIMLVDITNRAEDNFNLNIWKEIETNEKETDCIPRYHDMRSFDFLQLILWSMTFTLHVPIKYFPFINFRQTFCRNLGRL